MPATAEKSSVERVVQDIRRILKEETDQAKKKKFVESVVNALSDGYGEGPNFEEICNAAVKLARSAYQKSEGTEEVEDALVSNMLAAEELDAEDLMKMPWMWCITLSQLKEIARCAENLHGKWWYENANMHQIVQEIIAPICARTKKGYWASQNPKGLKVTVFVTHSWNENFSEMVDSISSVFKNSLQEPHLWICAFALLQGDYNVIKAQVGTTLRSSLRSSVVLRASPFVQALEKADFFLVVRNSFGDLYSRIWCVCELMFAMEFNLVPSRTYITGPDDFADSIGGCMEAEASVEEDKEKILQHLTATLGQEKVDEKIQEFRNMKLPSQTNSARRLKFIIGFLVCVMVAAAIALPLVLKDPLTTEQILRNIIEPELKVILNDENYNALSPNHTYRGDALSWLEDEFDRKNLEMSDTRDILQKYCLITILDSTSVNNCWYNTSNWQKKTDECSWYGVACTNKSTITKLNLSSNNLNGNIPVEIGYFRNLKVLDVSSNKITGTMISNLGNLRSLEYLNISNNKITGTMISNLGNLRSLEYLNISNNNITGTIPPDLGYLEGLKYFDISNNTITGVPKEIGSLSKLTSLWLHRNALTGRVPKRVNELMKVIQKNYSDVILEKVPTNNTAFYSYGTIQFDSFQTILHNNVDDEIHLSEKLWQRYVLYMLYYSTNGDEWERNGNWLSQIDYCAWSWFDVYYKQRGVTCNKEGEVVSLDLGWNNLVGRIPMELIAFTKLTYLNLGNNELFGTIPTEMGRLTSLERLWLNNNHLSGTISSELGQLTKLTRLSLYNNSLYGIIPNILCQNSRYSSWYYIACDGKIECECCVGWNSVTNSWDSCPNY